MSDFGRIYDQRGVDVAQIRELLALTPAQRVAHMVHVVNTLRGIANHAKSADYEGYIQVDIKP